MAVTVSAVCVGKVATLYQGDTPKPSAFAKHAIEGPVRLTAGGVVGDEIGNPAVHGTPDKAVLLYAAAHHPRWADRFGIDIGPGGLGENVTLDGVDETGVCVGDTWRIGGALVQVSQPRHPCWKIDARWDVKGLTEAVLKSGATGWYVRVLEDGDAAAADVAELLDRPHPEMTVQHLNDVYLDRKNRPDDWAAISACPAVSAEWL